VSTLPITRNRMFEFVTPAEMEQVEHGIRQKRRYPAIDKAVRYLSSEVPGAAVKVKVIERRALKRMRESAIGYAERRGFLVSTRHLAGWLYIRKEQPSL